MSMRNLIPGDMHRVIELYREQNDRDGTRYPLPRMFGERGSFDPDIALALAVERRGQLRQAIYFQSRGVEMCFAGCDARATLSASMEMNAVAYTLRSLGHKRIHTFIPHIRVPQLEGALLETGFLRKDKEFAHFFYDLEEPL